MQVDDFIQSIPRAPFSMPQVSWLAGAAAGLRVAENRSPSWLWEEFYDDIFQMIRLVGDVEAAGLSKTESVGKCFLILS